jgi:hypothetical protein
MEKTTGCIIDFNTLKYKLCLIYIHIKDLCESSGKDDPFKNKNKKATQ